MEGERGENCNKLYHFLRKVFLPMSGYDKMHQSLLDGQKVCLFIEAFHYIYIGPFTLMDDYLISCTL